MNLDFAVRKRRRRGCQRIVSIVRATIINSILDLMLPEPELGISVASLVSQQESYLELLLSTPKYSIEISSQILFSRQRN